MSADHKVFISYTQRDVDVAASLASKLQEAGLKCFLADRSILAAAEWEPALREALRATECVLLLMTPRSKTSLWVAAEAGAAWILEKPLIPVLMFVDVEELFDPIRKFQVRVVETASQVDSLVQELKSTSLMGYGRRGVTLQTTAVEPEEDLDGPGSYSAEMRLTPHLQLESLDVNSRLVTNRDTSAPESFTSAVGWEGLIRAGEWSRDGDTGFIDGKGTHRYLLSHRNYGSRPFTIRCRLSFSDWSPEKEGTEVYAGIVFGWRALLSGSKFYHLAFTGSRLLLETVEPSDGPEGYSCARVDSGAPFDVECDRPYELVIQVAGESVSVSCDGRVVYGATLEGTIAAGRVGLRPWRSRLRCDRFVVENANPTHDR